MNNASPSPPWNFDANVFGFLARAAGQGWVHWVHSATFVPRFCDLACHYLVLCISMHKKITVVAWSSSKGI